LEELRRLEAGATSCPWTPQDYDHNPGDQGVPIIGGGELGSMAGHLTAYTMTLGNEPQSVADAEFIVAARNQVPGILAALDAVLALHHGNRWGFCEECSEHIDVPMPCPTVRAVTEALEGK
jgi:hypothetical protein